MAKYRYTAADGRGKWTSGEAEGRTRDEVEARLRGDGLVVESLVEAEDDGRSGGPSSPTGTSSSWSGSSPGWPGPASRSPRGSGRSAAEVASPALRSVLGDLATSIEAGAGLEPALGSRGDQYPEHLRGLILAGARSGRLADVLAEYVRVANLGSELRRKFWSVVAYPLTTVVLVLVLVVFVCSLSVQAAESLTGGMRDFGVQQPAQAEVLAVMARAVADHWPGAVVGSVGLIAVTWLFLRFTLTPARRRRLACGVPVVGPTLRFISLTAFCRLLAMLLEAETPMPEALELAGHGIRDADMAEACDRMASSVARGQPLSRAMRLWDSMPAGLGQLFHWSEGHRSLPEALRMAGDMFEARARSQAGFAANFLNTLLVLLILWWVGFALATLYLPLISMMRIISVLSGTTVLSG